LFKLHTNHGQIIHPRSNSAGSGFTGRKSHYGKLKETTESLCT